MLDIPVVTINERSPYEVISVEQNSFLFKTQYGIKYNVGFMPDTLLDSKEKIYHFYLTNEDQSHFRHDPLLYKTIEVILEVFFMQSDNVMIYMCDMIDGRQANRNRLFKTWFNHYPDNYLYTFMNKTLIYEELCFYGALILKKAHPNHDKIIERFNSYIDELEGKISPNSNHSL